MSEARILIDRLTVDLFGASAEVGTAFAEELEGSLRERLERVSPEMVLSGGRRPGSLSLGRLDVAAASPEALAGAVADRLLDALAGRSPERGERGL